MLVVCGIMDTNNTAGNHSTHRFIDSQGFMGIDYLTMLHIKNVPHMIKDHNLTPNKDSRLGTIQHRRLQYLVWWAKDHQCCGLEITSDAWTAAELTSSITKMNIESPSGGDIKVSHPSKV